ncbi:MAG: hypothetical protein WBR26_12925 [Candidatus Acidiferrum sp.]
MSSLAGALVLVSAFLVSAAYAQNPDTMGLAENEAKAKQLLKQSIDAMGGPLFRDQSESECEGRVAQLDRNGGILGFSFIKTYWHYPDKNRIEYIVHSTKAGYFGILIGDFPLPVKGGEFIQLFNGDSGWTMDKAGVSDADATMVSEFQDSLKRQLRNLLLHRANEDGVFLHYSGIGTADIREADWIEFSDENDRVVRMALEHESHLPLRTVAITPNEEMHDKDEDITIYSNYKEHEGVQFPMQITREHNGLRTHQTFYSSCSNAPNLPPDFFTEESLQKRFKQTGGKAAKNQK